MSEVGAAPAEGPSTAAGDTSGDHRADPLDALRTEFEGPVDDLPVAERVSRFEHVNDVLARELALLDEV